MRIVSLLPSATEIVCAVGAGPELVAVTHECDCPDFVRALPSVTSNALPLENASPQAVDRHIRQARHEGSGIYHLDARRLADLEPTLIITQELCDVCAVSYQQVSAAARELPGEVPILSLEPRTLMDIASTLEAVGRASAHAREGAAAADAFRRELERRAALLPSQRCRVVAIEWTEPAMVGGHWVPQMIALAGGIDVLGKAGEPSRYVTCAEIAAAAPEIIVFMPCGYGVERSLELARSMLAAPELAAVPAVISGRLVAVDGSSYFNRPGPRVLDGMRLLDACFSAAPGEALPPGAAWATVPSGGPQDLAQARPPSHARP